MKFTSSLIKGKLIKRYKRFFVDIKLNKKTIIAEKTTSLRKCPPSAILIKPRIKPKYFIIIL